MLKELINTGIGAGFLLKEKVEEELQSLEEKGKINSKDAKSFMESLEKKGEEQKEKSKEDLKEALKEVIDELGLATKADLERLKEELK